MLLLYNFGISLYNLLLHLVSFFNPKAKLFIDGRKNIFELIARKTNADCKHIWFHFASLGEFEQGRPVLEELKKLYPDKPIVMTFFSPSGFEIRKNYPLAEAVYYLPLDTHRNAETFLRLINPEIAIFTKYEFWYHYFKVLKANKVPLLLISGIFRPDQIFFKWYGRFQRNILKNVTHFFVQNQESKSLLNNLGIDAVSISGDTRFDRVAEQAASPQQFVQIDEFKGNAKIFIAGSTWPQDEELIAFLQQRAQDWKFIIAPHEIHESHIKQLSALFPDALHYTKLNENTDLQAAKVLIIDTIGLLSSAYQYGDISYIGGGFGAGIHNTLEAAAFGSPVIFGPKYQKFQEAKDLLTIGAAKSVSGKDDLFAAFEILQKDQQAGKKAASYVKQHTGSTLQIINMIKKLI
ncbi:3-deoxy-D-manno-octulosonic acid transferase [Pedobacter antarcticus 4BY]|uniref:3-deoxy-D-manno-octulosonic acid transferase n=2 Tax=Pedobacter antarcticus TaxID=34086 RepID=A0A081PIE0_9SPHI|nr:glycosyltransferase N-terminal domain-containing protein [Pedobacter antarcticus]KEQ30463.1 3-deoxy-D-manno-octulosonic acid transferase [Pedobacter antarcticus 4BY]SFF38063.1 3-deoxy-D-manno-octulosonic-acid transferase [Pedobacter antarcticus]